MKKSQSRFLKQLVNVLLFPILAVSVQADDTEIFTDNRPPPPPNILFILDFSGSMSTRVSGSNLTRAETLRDAFKKVMSDKSLNANVGILGFSGRRASSHGIKNANLQGVTFPISPLDDLAATTLLSNQEAIGSQGSVFTLDDDSLPNPLSDELNRDYFLRVLDEWSPGGGTPLVDAYYEAALYFRGQASKWGQFTPNENSSAHPSTYRLQPGSSTAVYNSPIGECSNNVIVLLSDGIPGTTQSTNDISQTIGENCNGLCGVELAKFLATEDQHPGVEDKNTVTTYTIGFDVQDGSTAQQFLTGVAQAGEGGYYSSDDTNSFVEAVRSIVSKSQRQSKSFVTPVYTVNASSSLAHSRDIYIPFFEHNNGSRWSGNLKKFRLNDKGQIVDKKGKVAVNAEGVLNPDAADLWSIKDPGADGTSTVTTGGFANLLDPSKRKLITERSTKAISKLDKDSIASKYKLPEWLKRLFEKRFKISFEDRYQSKTSSKSKKSTKSKKSEKSKKSAKSETEHVGKLQKFIHGYKEDGTPRYHAGDILHSKPVVVPYGDKDVIFVGTNEGYLHAITEKGKELFAFMPSSLVSNIEEQYENKALRDSSYRSYGLDGEITVWLSDKNKNGKIDVQDNDKAYLYFGLRRGGSAYYAMDVTDPDSPQLMWTINDDTFGFERLGQTWSKPTLGKLRYKDSGSIKFEEVLVFGGGYDDLVYDEEDVSERDYDNLKGNGIYIVNAKTGKYIWSYDSLDLKDSVPSSINVLDVNRDGSIDRLYFGDLGGNVWRVDLNADDFDNDKSLHDVKQDARIYKLASLGGNAGDKRKFFHKPDVAMFKHEGKLVITVAIGSGYRAHPKNTNIQDRFYVINDENALSVPTNAPQPLTEDQLTTPNALVGEDFLPNNKGWYKNLVNSDGEKVLSTPLTFMNKVMFTTFGLTAPATHANDPCSQVENNVSRAYVLDLMTGAATADLDGDGVVTKQDESAVVGSGEIPGTPQLVFNEPSNCTKDGCDHFVDVRVGKMEKPLINKDTQGGNVNLGEYLPKVFWLDKNQY